MPSPAQAVSGEQQEVEQDQDQDQSDPLGGGVLHHPVERIDEDHSGSIDCEEFRAGMAQIGLKFDNAAIEEIMEFMKVLPSHPTVLHYM
jgi:hypothetical protein